VARPVPSGQPKIRLTESGTDLITILKVFSFVLNSRYITKQHSLKIKFSLPKTDFPSRCTLVSTSSRQLVQLGYDKISAKSTRKLQPRDITGLGEELSLV
jgi:hypothetical protein